MYVFNLITGSGPFFIANFPFKTRSQYKMQLTGSKLSNEGWVEIKRKDEFGVISDKACDLKDATVICRQLGFKKGAIDIKPPLVEKGRKELAFTVTDLQCSGDENVIDDCKYKVVESIEEDFKVETVGVECSTGKDVL